MQEHDTNRARPAYTSKARKGFISTRLCLILGFIAVALKVFQWFWVGGAL